MSLAQVDFAFVFRLSGRGTACLGVAFLLGACAELPEKLQDISIVALEENESTTLRGAQLAIERVNAAGGVLEGRSLLWTSAESVATPLDEGALLFLSADGALAEENAALFTAKAVHLSLSRSDALHLENGDAEIDFWNFSVLSPARYSSKIFAQLFATGEVLEGYAETQPQLTLPQCTQAAVISVDDGAGNAFAEVFAEDFQARGGRIPAAFKVSFSDENTTAAQEELTTTMAALDENLSFCVLLDVPSEQATDWVEMISASLLGRNGPWLILASARAADEALASANVPVARLFALKPHLDFAAVASSEFAVAFQSRFGDAPSVKDAAAYDAASLMALSLIAAEQESAEAVRDALFEVSRGGTVQDGAESFAPLKAALQNGEDIDYQGPSGKLDFDDEAGVKTDFVLIVPERIEGEMVWNPIAKIPAALWE